MAAALQEAADAKMDSMIEDDKSHLEVQWSDDMLVHDLIWIKKMPERIDTMTGKIALRCIGVYCPINATLEFPQYWAEESPNMPTMIGEAPSDCVWQIPSDAKDAYHAIIVHVDSRKYLGLRYFSKKIFLCMYVSSIYCVILVFLYFCSSFVPPDFDRA